MTKQVQLRTQVLVWTAMFGVLTPGSLATAGEPAREARAPVRRAAVVDAVLTKSGALGGKVYNAQGTPLADVDVLVIASRGEVLRSRSNGEGEFKVDGLKGGVYHVAAGHGSQVVRAWTENAAPPTSQQQVLIVSDPLVALGQYEPGTFGHFLGEAKHMLSNPLIVGGIIAAAVAIPVAIHNSGDDDEPTGS